MAKKVNRDIKAAVQKQGAMTGSEVADRKETGFSLLAFRNQAIILSLLCLIFYCNTFSHESAFDDRMAITNNEYVQQGLAGIPDILTKDSYQSYLEQRNGGNQLAGGRYRPLSLITFAIEQQILGINNEETPVAQEHKMIQDMHARHVVNVLLYILSVIVLLYFFRRVVFPGNHLAAFVAALVFTILPIHTEVVANVKSRDEILSVLFICLTFIKAFGYRESRKTKDLALALLCFFLALLSKEYAVTLIVLLPLSLYIFGKESVRNSCKTILPYLIPLAVYLLLRFKAVTAMAEGAENSVLNNPYLYASGMQKVATEILVLLSYLKLLIFPNVLAADYSYNRIPYTDFTNPIVWLSLIIHLAMIAAMCILFARRHVLCFAAAIYLAYLLLISNLFFNIGAPMGERLIYHSSIGFSIAVGYLLYIGFEKIKSPQISRISLAGIVVVLIVLSGFKTISRNNDWKNDETLFMTDVKKAPNSVLINNNAAASCMSNAKKNAADITVRNEWFLKAISYFDKAISIYPGHTLAHLNRGLCYYNMGIPDKALPDWDTVRKYTPNEQNLPKYLSIAGRYFYSQGAAYEKSGMHDSAIIAFTKCADATPEIPDAWFNLGSAYFTAGKIPEARANVEKALQLAPKYMDALKLYAQIKNVAGSQ